MDNSNMPKIFYRNDVHFKRIKNVGICFFTIIICFHNVWDASSNMVESFLGLYILQIDIVGSSREEQISSGIHPAIPGHSGQWTKTKAKSQH